MKYLISLLFIFIAGCGNSGDENPNSSQLNGTWKSMCTEWIIDNIPSGEYFIEEITLNNSSYLSYSISYSDLNCTSPNGNTDTYTGTYTVKEQVTTLSGLKPNRVTVEITHPFDQNLQITTEYIVLREDHILYFGLWTVNGPYTLLLDEPYSLSN